MIGLLCAFLTFGVFEPHKLKTPISWKFNDKIENMAIRSVVSLDAGDTKTIQHEVANVRDAFFRHYNKECVLGSIEVRIITLNQMNSLRYFYVVVPDGIIRGRFFGYNNIVYITQQALYDTYVLRHELAHYMYDECGVRFDNDDLEHRELNEFLIKELI